MGCGQGRWCGLRLRFSPQDRGGNQRDDEPDREGFDEGDGGIEERIFVHLFVFFQLLELSLDGGRTGSRGLQLFDHIGAVFIHEIVQDGEVESLPRHDIEDARNQGDRDADGKAFGER